MTVAATFWSPGQLPGFRPGVDRGTFQAAPTTDSGVIDVTWATSVTFSASVDAIVGGTSPSVTFYLEQLQEPEGQGAASSWPFGAAYGAVWKQLGSWVVNGIGNTGAQVVNGPFAPAALRVRWVVSGNPSTLHFTPSLTGQTNDY